MDQVEGREKNSRAVSECSQSKPKHFGRGEEVGENRGRRIWKEGKGKKKQGFAGAVIGLMKEKNVQ